MAEAIVSTILEKLTAITIEKASKAWRLVSGVEKEVKRLESNFKAIQYELEDAEEKQFRDKRLKLWLERFKEVSYDMEDVLDDWKTAVRDLQTADHGVETSYTSVPKKWKVCQFVSSFFFGSQVVRRHDIASRIKDIDEELEQIVKDKDKFELIKRESIKQPKRPESTCFVDVSKLHGRDTVKEEVIRTLLYGISEEEESCIPIITMVGMGGIGKTALAQLIYNDHRIQTHFDNKIWVCVSDPLDQRQIAQAILEGLDSTIFLQNTTPLQILFTKIHENMKKKKFFLVLDDVWTDHGQDWEQLKATFQSVLLGSRILITTRKESVAKHMESTHIFHLDLLSEEICWQILSQKAFFGRNQIVSRENVEDIGREIAKKCKGLPLAAITLGSLLQDKLRREEWQNVLNSETWKLDFAQEYIFTPLLLSYYDLPPTMRRCLLYCAIFPKDTIICKDLLIQHWMAQGYLNSENNLKRELKGEDYFSCLASRSFFQNFEKDANDNIICCKMHDMVHDFVQFLTENRFVKGKIAEDFTLDLSSKKPRHLLLGIENCSSSPMSIYGTEKLRSLAVVSLGYNEKPGEVLRNLFSGPKHLRILVFYRFHLDTKEIVRGIGNMIQLRYLGLNFCSGIENLFEAVCELPNLQTLDVQCEGLQKLPTGVGKLIKVSYLDTECCFGLTYYPKEISNLTSLMRLVGIKMRADRNDAEEFSIGDLENLDLLGGNLCVELTGDSIDWDEGKRAKLHNKTHLKRMEIWLCSPHIKKEEVLQALKPPSNLPVVLFDYQSWLRCGRHPARSKIRVAHLTQRAAFQLIEANAFGEESSFFSYYMVNKLEEKKRINLNISFYLRVITDKFNLAIFLKAILSRYILICLKNYEI